MQCLNFAHVYLQVVVPYTTYDNDAAENQTDGQTEYDDNSDLDEWDDDDKGYECSAPSTALPPILYSNAACASSSILPMHSDPIETAYDMNVRIDEDVIRQWEQEDNCHSYWSDDSDEESL